MNKMKSLALLAIALSAMPVMAQQKRAASTGGNSPHETTGTVIGDRRTGCRVTITYGRPSTKAPNSTEDRKIWGTFSEKALVPYGKAWRMGSDEATLLITQQPLKFGDITIPAGAYTLYMVPEENGPSKLAISTRIGQWGVPVDETHDLARIDLKKESLDKSAEQFTMTIDKDPSTTNGGIIKLMWENTQFSAAFMVVKE